MKKILYIIVFSFLLILTSCKRELIVFEQTSYELGFNEVIELKYTTHPKVKEVEFIEEDKTIVEYIDGKLYSRSYGDSKVYVKYKDKNIAELNVRVTNKLPEFIVGNIEKNEMLLSEISILVDSFELKMNNSNHLMLTVSEPNNNNKIILKEKIIANPMYLELQTTYTDDPLIYKLENDKVFFYEFKENYNIKKHYLGSIEEFHKAILNTEIDFSSFEELDTTKINVECIEDKYFIQMYYKDIKEMINSLDTNGGITYQPVLNDNDHVSITLQNVPKKIKH